MNKKNVFFTGSFNPITNGHLDIIKRGYKLFGNINILILENRNKKNDFLTAFERKEIIEKVLKRENIQGNVYIENNLFVENIEKYNIDIVIKGIRDSKDYEYEKMQNQINLDLSKNLKQIEYVYLFSSIEKVYISSSMVRELLQFGGDVSKYVPYEVLEKLSKREENV